MKKTLPHEDECIRLLKEYSLSPQRIRHSIGVADIARIVAKSIFKRNPEMTLDPEKVHRAALLHDIGRGIPGDHEVNSRTILHGRGLHECAECVMHGSIYEEKKHAGIHDPSLLPKTLENKIVAWADAHFRLSPVNLSQRMADIENRRARESEKCAAVRASRGRYEKIHQELALLLGEDPFSLIQKEYNESTGM